MDHARAFDCVGHHRLFLKGWDTSPPDLHLRNLCAGQEATLRTDMEQQTGSKYEKEYVKAVYCHPAYLTYMQSTS